jgi:hypothetical protein
MINCHISFPLAQLRTVLVDEQWKMGEGWWLPVEGAV